MSDDPYTAFLQWTLPRLGKRWDGYRQVRGQVESRLTDRLQELCLWSLGAYRAYLQSHPDEWERLDAMCRIPVSRFYRDPAVYNALCDAVLPSLAQAHRSETNASLRAWRGRGVRRGIIHPAHPLAARAPRSLRRASSPRNGVGSSVAHATTGGAGLSLARNAQGPAECVDRPRLCLRSRP